MMKYFFYLLTILSSCSTMNKSKTGGAAESVSRYESDYTYADGSGNGYVFNKSNFEYFPVKPEHSSTGHYSGGEYVKLKPGPEEVQKVIDLIHAAKADTAEHVQNRDKGTGQVSIKNKNGVQSFILYMQSLHKKLIEEALIKIKEKR